MTDLKKIGRIQHDLAIYQDDDEPYGFALFYKDDEDNWQSLDWQTLFDRIDSHVKKFNAPRGVSLLQYSTEGNGGITFLSVELTEADGELFEKYGAITVHYLVLPFTNKQTRKLGKSTYWYDIQGTATIDDKPFVRTPVEGRITVDPDKTRVEAENG